MKTVSEIKNQQQTHTHQSRVLKKKTARENIRNSKTERKTKRFFSVVVLFVIFFIGVSVNVRVFTRVVNGSNNNNKWKKYVPMEAKKMNIKTNEEKKLNMHRKIYENWSKISAVYTDKKVCACVWQRQWICVRVYKTVKHLKRIETYTNTYDTTTKPTRTSDIYRYNSSWNSETRKGK